jgi:FAD synthase
MLEEKFDSLEDLKAQIAKDKINATDFLRIKNRASG